jgi:predicted DNA-binding antitoxin AbrB/MazE fold protein
MTQVVRAIFENGLLRPLDRLLLENHQQVRVIVESVEQPPATKKDDDPLAGLRVSTGIADLAERFEDYRFGRRTP